MNRWNAAFIDLFQGQRIHHGMQGFIIVKRRQQPLPQRLSVAV